MSELFKSEVHTFCIKDEKILYEPKSWAIFKIDVDTLCVSYRRIINFLVIL